MKKTIVLLIACSSMLMALTQESCTSGMSGDRKKIDVCFSSSTQNAIALKSGLVKVIAMRRIESIAPQADLTYFIEGIRSDAFSLSGLTEGYSDFKITKFSF